MRRKLETGEAKTQGDLAALYRISQPRVVQLLGLLKLAPEILSYVKTMLPGPKAKIATEKQLRGSVSITPTNNKSLPSFARLVQKISNNKL
jgi:hypothetical protein